MVTDSLYNSRGHLVTSFRKDFLTERAILYADAFHQNGAPQNCIGLINGARICMARPGGNSAKQLSTFSDHKRTHCFAYQTVTTPDGLVFHIHGPTEGRRSDAFMFRHSGLRPILEECMKIEDTQFCMYGDWAYILL